MQVVKPRFESVTDAVAWLTGQKGVLPDPKNHTLMIVRSSLRIQGALDYVAKFKGVRVFRDVRMKAHLGTRNQAVVEGLGGIL